MTWLDRLQEWAEAEEDTLLDFDGLEVPERMQRLLTMAFVNNAPAPKEPGPIQG